MTAAPLDADCLREIRERANAATPGPWGHKAGIAKHYVFSTDEKEDLGFSLQEIHWSDGREVPAGANARFIANARTDVPDLLAEVQRLSAESALRTYGYHTAQCPLSPPHDHHALCTCGLDALRGKP